MDSKKWKDIAEVIGISAIVASLIFVGLELSQSRNAVLSETAASLLTARVDLNNYVGDHADIWVKGNSGVELNESEYATYYQIIESMHWLVWSSWRHSLRFDVDIPRELAIADFAGFLNRNPGALGTWKEYVANRESVRVALVSGYDENRFNSAVLAYLERLAEPTN